MLFLRVSDSKAKWWILICSVLSLCFHLWFAVRLISKSRPLNLGLFEASRRFDAMGYSSVGVAPTRNDVVPIGNRKATERRRLNGPIVTMFTTIRDRECRKDIHNRLIRNWAALGPDLDPVLFVPVTEYNTSSWINTATSNNWTVRVLYALRSNLPILTAMFKDAIARSRSPFIGYANADILFDRSLILTLCSLNQRLNLANETILIIGRRRNVDIVKIDLGSGYNLTKISLMDRIKPFHGMAQDYFITTRRGLSWKEIPDFVVGRNGYDNWLVAKALDWNITLIDASRTVLALHQSGIDGYMSGSKTVAKETKYINLRLGRGVRYRQGVTGYAPFYTNGTCGFQPKRSRFIHCNKIYNITLCGRPGKINLPLAKKLTTRLAINARVVDSVPQNKKRHVKSRLPH